MLQSLSVRTVIAWLIIAAIIVFISLQIHA